MEGRSLIFTSYSQNINTKQNKTYNWNYIRHLGSPAVAPPTHQGFGTRVMDRMIRVQLKGQMLFDWRPEGLTCEITVQT
jgi:two-component sensor histidine kinase